MIGIFSFETHQSFYDMENPPNHLVLKTLKTVQFRTDKKTRNFSQFELPKLTFNSQNVFFGFQKSLS